jgi:hypothetical protein
VHDIATALGLSMGDLFPLADHIDSETHGVRDREPVQPIADLAEDVARVWQLALGRARDDDAVEADRDAYDYLARRGLVAAWESGVLGVLHPGVQVPDMISRWPAGGWRIVTPLYDVATGELTGLQARRISPGEPKCLTLGRAAGAAFANTRALHLITDHAEHATRVVLLEGLTDHLAAAAAVGDLTALVSVPGIRNARQAIGPWIAGAQATRSFRR